MSISAFTGPVVAFGAAQSSDYNPEQGPSLFISGQGVLDPRPQFTYQPGQRGGQPTMGWLGTTRIQTANVIPVAISTALIAAAAHTTGGTAMTLASSTTTGLAVGVSIARQDTGAVVTGLLELDPPVASVTASIPAGSTIMNVTALGAGGGVGDNVLVPGMVLSGTSVATGTTLLQFGSSGTTGTGGTGTYNVSLPPTAAISGGTITGAYTGLNSGIAFGYSASIRYWNPADLLARAVSVTSITAQVVSTFTVRGFDVYGFPMTEVITLSGTVAGTTNGKKAFKYILSVTPNTTDSTNTYEINTTDIIGFPIRSDTLQVGIESDVTIMSNNATIAATTGYTAADKTVATGATGDVRGTFALQTASNGTLKLIFSQSPAAAAYASVAGLYGVTQFSDF